MKQRLAGKVIKYAERYPDDMLQRAYEKSVRGLRKCYKRQYKEDKTWMKKWYMHKACEPFFMLCDDVNEIWNVKEE